MEATGTLLTDFDTRKVVRLGFKVKWEGDLFELYDPAGERIEVLLEAGCPTVDVKVADRLIVELESYEADMTQRVAALRAGNPGDLAPCVWKWLSDLRKMWPEVPDELIARSFLQDDGRQIRCLSIVANDSGSCRVRQWCFICFPGPINLGGRSVWSPTHERFSASTSRLTPLRICCLTSSPASWRKCVKRGWLMQC